MIILNISGNKLFNSAEQGAAVGKVLGAMLQTNSTLRKLDVSNSMKVLNSPGGPWFAQELAVGLRDNGALTSLDLSSNCIGQLVLTDGITYSKAKSGKMLYWKDRKSLGADPPPGCGPIGVSSIADAISDMGAMSTFIFSGDDSRSTPVTMEISMTEADFSGKDLGASGALLVAAFLPKCTYVLLYPPPPAHRPLHQLTTLRQ
jgi:hypothetical protein